jgi:hypothetical protein
MKLVIVDTKRSNKLDAKSSVTFNIKRDRFLWKLRFLWKITQNHVDDENTVIHDSLYLHQLRDFERSSREKNLPEKTVALDIPLVIPFFGGIVVSCFLA